eukprot:7156183-Prymnesium_polylepis.1
MADEVGNQPADDAPDAAPEDPPGDDLQSQAGSTGSRAVESDSESNCDESDLDGLLVQEVIRMGERVHGANRRVAALLYAEADPNHQ